MAPTDAMPIPKRNVAYRHYFSVRKTDGTLITGWTSPSATRSIDGGTHAPAATPVEIATASGSGFIDLTAPEMNSDCTVVIVTVTNIDAVPYVVSLFPETAGDIRATSDLAAVLGTPVSEGTGGDLSNNFTQFFDVNPTSSNSIDSILDLTAAQVAADAALIANKLDRLLLVAAIDADVTDNSILAQMASKGGPANWQSYDNTTDSLEAGVDNVTARTLVAAGYFDPLADEVMADVVKVNADAIAAAALALSAGEMRTGTINGAVAPTPTQFEAADITDPNAGHWVPALALFTSGALKGHRANVTAYSLVAGRGRFTVDVMPIAPTVSDTFLVV